MFLFASRARLAVIVTVVLLLVGGFLALGKGDGYRVTMVLPNANNLFEGATVMRNGFEAGAVSDISVVDGKAQLTLDLDPEMGPLHEGARAEVIWKGILGERIVSLADGPRDQAEIPDGSLMTEVMAEPVEISQVLAALDAPTREKLNSLVGRLDATTSGREKQIQQTLQTAGPAVAALGAVLDELGTDGEAMKQIVVQSNDTMKILASRQDAIRQIVSNLGSLSSSVVTQREQLSKTLEALPGTIEQAEVTLSEVPGAVDAAVPLLEDLEPATGRLGTTANNLLPVMKDLRPAVADLRPTLASLSGLLTYTPALAATGTSTLPEVDEAVEGATPAVDFLRPYTPELVGWMSNWGSAGGNYDKNGHYARFHILAGLESVVGPSAGSGPGVTQNLKPKPGNPVGQPWNDAYGEGMR